MQSRKVRRLSTEGAARLSPVRPRRVAMRGPENGHPMLALSVLKVNETFVSVQGEGSLIGTPSFFIRLDGCPLRCKWCDTPYALAGDSGRAIDVDELADLAADLHHIVITGGEPLAQDIAPLVNRLSQAHHVTVETSGAIFADLPGVSLFSISPKVGSSGYRPKLGVLRKFCSSAPARLQFKFVIADDRDLDEAHACIAAIEDALPHTTPVILQPESGTAGRGDRYLAFLDELARNVLSSSRWRQFQPRVLPQLHYLMWGGEPGR